MDSTNATQCWQFNGDIAGSGVRVSFYVQNFILVLLVDRSEGSHADPENALWTFIATSFGLTIAAVLQVREAKLSLLEGILVSQLGWFANIGTFLALASYSRSKGEDTVVKVAAVLQGFFSMILTILMWVYAERFPYSRDCNFNFVFLFGLTLPALGRGRKVGLAFASLTLLIYTGVTSYECWGWWKHGRSRVRSRERRRRNGRRTEWLRTSMDPTFFGILLSQVIVLTYFISTTELIIRRNNAKPMDGFGFGQVLALTVLIPSLIALYRAFRDDPAARPSEPRREQEEHLFPINGHSSPRRETPTLLSPEIVETPTSALRPSHRVVDGSSSISILTTH